MSQESESARPLRLLSLDGGGIRGLSPIIILKDIMQTVNDERHQQWADELKYLKTYEKREHRIAEWMKQNEAPRELKPCEFFDLIGGTSTGGIIAVMLGKLRMTLEECEDAYLDLSRDIFKPLRNKVNPKKYTDMWHAKASFDTKALEQAIQKTIVAKQPLDSLLYDDESDCKVFLMAVNAKNCDRTTLRSYRNPHVSDMFSRSMKTWEACRATSAATTFFEPYVFGKHKTKFIDGGIQSNNPVFQVFNEAKDLWGNREATLISIGTGDCRPPSFQGNLACIGHTLKELVTQTEKTYEDFLQTYSSRFAAGWYYRFNVPEMATISLEEYEHLDLVHAETIRYLGKGNTKAQRLRCIETLLNTLSRDHIKPWTDSEKEAFLKTLHKNSGFIETQNTEMVLKDGRDDGDKPERAEGTCSWFLDHPRFDQWQSAETSQLLWVTADAGCGKSMLADFLSEELPKMDPLSIYCRFAFAHTRTTETHMLCAILHQALLHDGQLFKHTYGPCRGKDSGTLARDTVALWDILLAATKGEFSRRIVCIVDGLDECPERSRNSLIKTLRNTFCYQDGDRPRTATLQILVTSRPYAEIEKRFGDSSTIRLWLEDEDISEEISRVISQRVRQFVEAKSFSEDEIEYLKQQLKQRAGNTFLWVHLTMRTLEDQVPLLPGSIRSAIDNLPDDMYRLYDLAFETNKNPQYAQKILAVVIAAFRPLTLEEINIAVCIQDTDHSLAQIQHDCDIKATVKGLCKVFLRVSHGLVYLFHDTAREYLLGLSSRSTHHSLSKPTLRLVNCHQMLAKSCTTYLLLNDWSSIAQQERLANLVGWVRNNLDSHGLMQYDNAVSESMREHSIAPRDKQFYHYAANYWFQHVDLSAFDTEISLDETPNLDSFSKLGGLRSDLIVSLCNEKLPASALWMHQAALVIGDMGSLTQARSVCLVLVLINRSRCVARSWIYSRFYEALFYDATLNQPTTLVKTLFQISKDFLGPQKALGVFSEAVRRHRWPAASFLLDSVDPVHATRCLETTLRNKDAAAAEFLLESGIGVDLDVWLAVVTNRSMDMLQLIFAKGVMLDKDLSHAIVPAVIAHGDTEMLQLFLTHGAEVSGAVLSEAICRHDLGTLKCLSRHPNSIGGTLNDSWIHKSIENALYEEKVELATILWEFVPGFDPNAISTSMLHSLSHAARSVSQETISTLLQFRAGDRGCALMRAIEYDWDRPRISDLLSKPRSTSEADERRSEYLSQYHRCLLDRPYTQDALMLALLKALLGRQSNRTLVRDLLQRGAVIPLSPDRAVLLFQVILSSGWNGPDLKEITSRLKLLDHISDSRGARDSLVAACARGLHVVADHLFAAEMSINLPDSHGLTPLAAAVLSGNVGLCELLLKRGANPNLEVKDVRSTVSCLCSETYLRTAQDWLSEGPCPVRHILSEFWMGRPTDPSVCVLSDTGVFLPCPCKDEGPCIDALKMAKGAPASAPRMCSFTCHNLSTSKGTPLQLAILSSQWDIVSRLVQYGADGSGSLANDGSSIGILALRDTVLGGLKPPTSMRSEHTPRGYANPPALVALFQDICRYEQCSDRLPYKYQSSALFDPESCSSYEAPFDGLAGNRYMQLSQHEDWDYSQAWSERASSENDTQTIRGLLKQCLSRHMMPSQTDIANGHVDRSDALLYYVSHASHKESIETLLTVSGINANIRDSKFRSPLHAIVLSPFFSADAIRILLSCPLVDVNLRDKAGMTALHIAVVLQRIEVVAELVKSTRITYSVRKGTRYSVLEGLISLDQPTLVRNLLRVDDLQVNCKNAFGQAPIHLAAYARIHALRDLLVAEAIDANIQDDDGKTPLRVAVEFFWHIRALHTQTLMQQPDGQKGNALGNILTTTKQRQVEIIEALVQKETIDVNNQDHQGRTALHAMMGSNLTAKNKVFRMENFAISEKVHDGYMRQIRTTNRASVPILEFDSSNPLDHGVRAAEALLGHPLINPNVQDKDGNTPIHLAIWARDMVAVRLLINHENFDPNILDYNNQTALHSALIHGRLWIVKSLLSLSSTRTDIQNVLGQTPLHLVVSRLGVFLFPNDPKSRFDTMIDIVTALHVRHADFTIRDDQGRIPYDIVYCAPDYVDEEVMDRKRLLLALLEPQPQPSVSLDPDAFWDGTTSDHESGCWDSDTESVYSEQDAGNRSQEGIAEQEDSLSAPEDVGTGASGEAREDAIAEDAVDQVAVLGRGSIARVSNPVFNSWLEYSLF